MKPVESNRRHDFDRRSLLILGLNGCFLAVVAERLYQLQILEHEQYAVRSDENRVKLQLLVPRGDGYLIGTACCWPVTAGTTTFTSFPRVEKRAAAR